MRVMLLNDTATVPHVGCQAVSDAHARLLGAAGHQAVERYFLRDLTRFAGTDEAAGIASVLADEEMRHRIDMVDAVIVNGEGTLHHGFGSEYFAVLGAAQRLGKATLIVNSVFEANVGWEGTLSQLDDFCVRDARSLQAARAAGVRCRLVPDSALGAQFSDSGAYVDLTDRIVVTDWHPARDHDVGATLKALLDAVPESFYFPLLHGVQAHLWRCAVACWESAQCIITARHHGIYLAAAARKPFVALPSNTQKIEGLLEAAGVAIPVCTDLDGVVAAVQYAHDHLDEFERLYSFLNEALPLTTFAALGQGADTTSAEIEVARLADQVGNRSRSADPCFWGLGRSEQAEARRLG